MSREFDIFRKLVIFYAGVKLCPPINNAKYFHVHREREEQIKALLN